MTKSNVVIDVIGETVVSYATPGEFVDDDLCRLVEAWLTPGVSKYFAYNEGTIVISPKQRDEAKKSLRGKMVIAIVESAIMRGVVTAFRWIGLPVAAFSPYELDRAIYELGVGISESNKIKTAIERMQILARKTTQARVAS